MSLTPDLARDIRQMVKDIYSEREIPFAPLVGHSTIPNWIAIEKTFEEHKSPITDYKVSSRPSNIVAQPSRVKVTQVYNQSRWSDKSATGLPVTHFLVNPSTGTPTCHTTVTQSDIRTLLQVSSNTTAAKAQIHRNYFRKNNMAEQNTNLTGTESAEPFESVAEALHLQQSVIGNKHLTPAPPDVVAQLIAETERKMKEAASRGTPLNDGPFTVDMATAQPQNQMSQPSDSDGVNPSLTTPSVQTSPTSTGQSPAALQLQASLPQTSSQSDKGHNSNSTPSTTLAKELIRIPAQTITRTTEKQSWFGSNAGTNASSGKGQKPQIDPHNSQKSASDSSVSSVTASGDHVLAGASDHSQDIKQSLDNEDTMSVASSSTCSELDGFGDREMSDSFLKSLPPFKPVNLKDILPESKPQMRDSPPVKETSFRPVLSGNKNIQGNTSDTVQTMSGGHHPPALMHQTFSSDSGIVSPESKVVSPLLTRGYPGNYASPSKSFVIPKPGPLFQSTPKPLSSSYLSLAKSFTAPAPAGQGANQQLDEIKREKAKLEGQLEMLSVEAQATLQERAELQAQVASLKLKLMTQKGHGSDAEKDLLKADLNSLKQLRVSLEQSLGDLQRQLEEKAEEARNLTEELSQTQDSGDKLQLRMKEIRDEVRSKDMTIQALKNKVAELYVEVQMSLQTKMEADNEARSAKGDLAALQNAKTWYQQQLEVATKARSQLQRELTILQAQTVSQGNIIERLKTENTRLRQQLSEVQQRALKEKELLARHLEVIETDMMDREAAFQEIQRERSFIEDTFNTNIQTAEDERNRISLLMQMSTDLETQLDKAHGDLKKKQNQIFSLENEQINLMKQLSLSQDTVMEKDRVIEELKQNLIEVETRLTAFQNSLVSKDSEMFKLKEEKAITEIALKSAQQEKNSVDTALQTLKSDMGKVEKSFKQMRQELNSKTLEVNQVQTLGSTNRDQLETVKRQLEEERRAHELSVQEFTDKTQQIADLQAQKIALESEVIILREKLAGVEGSHEQAMQEKITLDTELTATREKLQEVQIKLQNVSVEYENSQKSSELETHQSEDYKQLEEDNLQMKSKLSAFEKDSKKDLMKQKARAVKLGADLKAVQTELTERQTTFDSNMEVMSSKLREISAEKDKLETELSMAHRKYELSMLEQQDQIGVELQSLASELEQVRLEKQTLEAALVELQHNKEQEVQYYQQELSALEEALQGLQAEQQENRLQTEQNADLALELEKEKGRLEGMIQNNATLKQHVSQLEEALARRESSLVDLQSHMQEALHDKEQETHDYIKRVQTLEENLQKEKDVQREVRKQSGLKITENKKLKRHNENLKQEHEQLRQDLEHRTQEVGILQAELDTSKQNLLSHQAEAKSLETENKSTTRELDRVKQMLADNMAREPVLQEQIQSLQWQLGLKVKELDAAQEQMKLAEKRQLAEINTLKQALQEKVNEVESLKLDITASKQDKQLQQVKTADLRSALKASIQHHKMANKVGKLRIMNGGSDAETVELPPLPFDLDEMDQLLQETSVRALESKPLDNLQNCLSTLRSEISGLQNQMEIHTTTVETSNNTWSSLEKEVAELRHVVKTITNSTMTTSSTTSIAAAAVEAADKQSQIIDV